MLPHKCYYCQGSVLYTFCEKYKTFDLTGENCRMILQELAKMEQYIVALEAKLQELESQLPSNPPETPP